MPANQVSNKNIFKNCEVDQTKRDTEARQQVQALWKSAKRDARYIWPLWNSEEENNRQDFNAATIQGFGLVEKPFLVVNPQLSMFSLRLSPAICSQIRFA
jgi:hypothetical protein